MKRIHFSMGMLSCGVLLVGCDETPTAIERTVQSEIAVDVGTLRAAARHTQEACVSPLREIHLTVAMANGRQEVLTRTLEAEPSVETFPVTVERGNVNFLVEVVSNNEMVLYRGSTTTEVRADGFTVPIVVEAVAPILQVCPEEVVLEPRSQCCSGFLAGNGFGGTFDVVNVGTDTLAWRAVAPSCDNEPCFGFDPEWGELLAGRRVSVIIGANTARLTVPTTLPIRIESQIGRAHV